MPDAHGQLGHSMVTQAGAGLPCELQVIDLLARPEGFEPPTTWFEVTRPATIQWLRLFN